MISKEDEFDLFIIDYILERLEKVKKYQSNIIPLKNNIFELRIFIDDENFNFKSNDIKNLILFKQRLDDYRSLYSETRFS